MILRARTDLPFERDQSTRFLPWIVALMVFLGALTFAGTLVVSDTIDSWDRTLTGRMTVQVPHDAGGGKTSELLVAMLEATHGITSVRTIPDTEARELLVPWLGEEAENLSLPVPELIDVELSTGAHIEASVLAARLAQAAPGTTVDDHRTRLSALINLGRTAEVLAFVILVLIAAAAVAAVIFTTQSGLAVHAAIIELLHQMGAQDSYIAGQFQIQAMILAIRGGIAGAMAAAIVLLVFAWVGQGIDAAFLPPVKLSVTEWTALLIVPVTAIVIAMLTARVTVLRALARMP
ncbi:MAG: cell division protein [Alphaproteobacteria bacterium]|nr:cell division protein [Alphaproteobacteria bacterium]